jgi:paraquat-inducible protein A
MVALSNPFLKITSHGLEQSMSLLETVTYLVSFGAASIALVVLLLVVVLPASVLLLILLVATHLRRRRYPPWMLPPTRWLFQLNGWAMVEVFSIGVIVSLVKLSSMARLELGLGFWAYMAFSVAFLVAFAGLDRVSVWQRVDALRDTG